MQSTTALRPLLLAAALAAACGSSRKGFDADPDAGVGANGGPAGPGLDTDGGCSGDGPCSPPPDETTCAGASQEASNIGCEFWAVDLDNEYSSFNDAAVAP